MPPSDTVSTVLPDKRPKHPGGRPHYTPTDADRATVRNMAAAGIPQHNICQCLGKKGIAEKTLRKHFEHELETSPHMVTGFAMSKLFAAIQAGEAWAICFWMKCKAGFQETSAHRFVDKEGEDSALKIVVEYADMPPKSSTPA
jgi:hypothetical protein